jgi:acyl-CoA synthetase (AMP-forming)/AMP-acid ligase II
MLVSDYLDQGIHGHSTAVALTCDGRQHTYIELHDATIRLACAVGSVTSPGDRVAILSENCAEYVVCYYGVPRAGRVLTFLNYRLAVPELETLLSNAQPRLLVVSRDYLETGVQLACAADFPVTLLVIGWLSGDPGSSYEEFLAAGRSSAVPPRPDDGEPAWLLFTSGTTGRPKGALLSHRNVLAGVTNSAMSWGPRRGGSLLFPWPMYHVAGYAILVAHLNGQTVHLMRRFDAGRVLQTISDHRITDVTLAPTMLNMLLEHEGSLTCDLSSIRIVTYGSAAMPLEILRAAMATLPAASFQTGFGMTELSGLAVFLSGDDHRLAASGSAHLLSSVGKPTGLAQVRLVDSRRNEVGTDDIGELMVRGDQVISEYWRGSDHPTGSVRDGWLMTGDLGRRDAEGYLYIVDRLKDMIITGGENVYSLEVEAALEAHRSVSMAAVFGVPDTHWGEVVTAAVRRAPGSAVSEEELIAHARTMLAGYKCPRHLFFVEDFPMNPTGKVLKHRLREAYLEGRA